MKIEWKRLSIESIAIVTSILLAFAIEAWWAEIQEREVEFRLLQGFNSDLVSDVDDLARAKLTISQRLWVLDSWLAELGDPIDFDRLVELSRSEPRIPVELRRAGNRMRQQIRYYDRILGELATFRDISQTEM